MYFGTNAVMLGCKHVGFHPVGGTGTIHARTETPTQPGKMSHVNLCAVTRRHLQTEELVLSGGRRRMRAGVLTSRDQRETISDLYSNVAFTHISKTSQLPPQR